jgi:5'-nucleotidase / UDP-sugar diphosphatase
MNQLRYDGMTLGSGDFAIGWDQLQTRMAEAVFPMLSANVVLSDTGELLGMPYFTRELTPEHKVAVIGLTDPQAENVAQAVHGQAIRVLDPVETLRRYVEEVASEADIIVLLSHLGFDADQTLAEQFPEIDIIVGGNSGHMFDPPIRPEPSGPIIVQSGSLGQRLGMVRLDFNDQGEVVGWDGRLITLLPEVPEDPAMTQLLRGYEDMLRPTTPGSPSKAGE